MFYWFGEFTKFESKSPFKTQIYPQRICMSLSKPQQDKAGSNYMNGGEF